MLHAHSDILHLSCYQVQSQAGGYFFLRRPPKNTTIFPPSDSAPPPINGAILVLSSIMRNIVSSDTKAELGALIHNVKEAETILTVLRDLSHP